jgi:hypothetical protein
VARKLACQPADLVATTWLPVVTQRLWHASLPYRPRPCRKKRRSRGGGGARSSTNPYAQLSGKRQFRQYAVVQGLKMKVHDLLPIGIAS